MSLKIKEQLPHIDDWANTATRILRELIFKHNALVDEHEELKKKVESNSKPRKSYKDVIRR